MHRYLTTKRINQIAWKLLQDVGVTKPSVDVKNIASNHLNLEIKIDDLGEEISGLLVTKNGQTYIGLNSKYNNSAGQNRQRFTIAHEIGHFVLKHKREGMFVDESKLHFSMFMRNELSSQGINKQEIEANAFAAALLMPELFVRDEIKKMMDGGDGFDLTEDSNSFIKNLAKKFKVSTMAMTYRIGNLNLFNTL